MKKNELKRWFALGVAVMMGVAVTGCAGEKQETVNEEVTVVVEEVTEPEQEEAAEETVEVEATEEETEETEAAEEEEETSEEGAISFDDVMSSYQELVDLYNQVNELYQSEDVPQDDGVEEIFAEVSERMDAIEALQPSDIPTDEDKMVVLSDISNLGTALQQLIDPLVEAAKETAAEEDYFNRLRGLVEQNYNYMNAYFNSVWDHLSTYGGTDAQIKGVLQARDEIGDLGEISVEDAEGLDYLNDRINEVISLLDAICGH